MILYSFDLPASFTISTVVVAFHKVATLYLRLMKSIHDNDRYEEPDHVLVSVRVDRCNLKVSLDVRSAWVQ